MPCSQDVGTLFSCGDRAALIAVSGLCHVVLRAANEPHPVPNTFHIVTGPQVRRRPGGAILVRQHPARHPTEQPRGCKGGDTGTGKQRRGGKEKSVRPEARKSCQALAYCSTRSVSAAVISAPFIGCHVASSESATTGTQISTSAYIPRRITPPPCPSRPASLCRA